MGKFVALPAYMLATEAWRALSLPGRCALIELLRVYNGANNGELVMGVRTLAERLSCSKATAARVLNELEEKGFIGVQKVGVYGRPNATEYHLTMHRNDVDFALPSKAFMRWRAVSKTNATVSPEGQSQQYFKEQSHQRDCKPPNGPILSTSGETIYI
jgi:DNA-binding HxlR family transcriptional regulator